MLVNVMVKRNIGKNSIDSFGEVGSIITVKVVNDSCKIWDKYEQQHYWDCSSYYEGDVIEAVNARFSRSEYYKTVFEHAEDGGSVILNGKKHYYFETCTLYSFIKKEVNLEANATIVYNNSIIKIDNAWNEHIRLKQNDIIDTIYDSSKEELDIDSLISLDKKEK